MTPADTHTRLRADPDRLAARIEEFAALTEAGTGPGVTRLAHTPLERRAHEVFAREMTRLGLRVHTDEAGNTLAERPGTLPGLPALGTGSHLDSVPHAGAFDGIAGVCAAMETARLLTEKGVEHRHPLRFVAFAAEEGARFGQACTGSRIAAGLTGPGDLRRLRDADGVTMAEAMRAVGLDPDAVPLARWSPQEWSAFLELHIEQGGVLEAEGLPVGVVDLISGSTRLLLTLEGRASHTGGTPMHLRRDAMAAAAEIVLLAESLANDSRHRGTRATVGKIEAAPGSITTIAGSVRLYVDVRDVDSDRQRATAAELVARARALAAARQVGLSSVTLADASPVILPRRIRDSVARCCEDLSVDYRVLPSGASHDAQMINHVVPTGMIFVPSKDGVSHSPAEWTSARELAVGTDVLTAALLALDRTTDPDGPPCTEPACDDEEAPV